MKKENMIGVLVAVKPSAILFGYIESVEQFKEDLTLHDCRMAVYYSGGGFNGLAVDGPPDGSRITKPIKKGWKAMRLSDVECVCICSKKAIEEWEKGKWA